VQDNNGHGTFVAGLIGSRTYGVSKAVQMVSIKILDENGEGSLSDVLKGLEYTVGLLNNNTNNNNNNKTIINISAGARRSRALNDFIDSIVDSGTPVVVHHHIYLYTNTGM
jgi:subtilisin family serine protease